MTASHPQYFIVTDSISPHSNSQLLTAIHCDEPNTGFEPRLISAHFFCPLVWLAVTKNLKCIGAIHTEFTTKKGTSSVWHYYISSRQLKAEELLHHARMEWSVESMHWLLDVHFEEDWCRVESKAVQQCLNMFRKAAINLIKRFKSSVNSKQAISHLMFECLLDSRMILRILNEN